MAPLFGFPIRSDQGTLTGGSWQSTLPLFHLQSTDPAKKARSTDAVATSTIIDVDLGGAYPIRGLALFGHNLTLGASVRVYGATSAAFASPGYDPGIGGAYPSVFYPAEATLWGVDVANQPLTALEYADGRRLPYIHLPSTAQTYQHWRLEIIDTGNPDGYVEISRLVVFQGWQPAHNIAVGSKVEYATRSESIETDGGTLIHRRRPRYRKMYFTLPRLEIDEALVQTTELLNRIGTTEQVFWVTDLADSVHLHRRSMLGTLEQATALEFPVAGDYSDTSFVLREVIFP